MIQPTSTEAMYQALFLLLSQTQLNEENAFKTSSRRLPPIANVSSGMQPFFGMLESEEVVEEKDNGLPIEEHKVAAVVLFRIPADLTTVASTQLNNMRDAVVNQLRNFTLSAGGVLPVRPLMPGEKQTLGGLVYHCRILGRVLKNEGLQNQQAAILFPISILAGM